jgi:hypothetical protein
VGALTAGDFDALADARFQDAEALLAAGRYEGARYLCGYVVELKLKARICRAHGWQAFPPHPALSQALKTHKLEVLLLLSGLHATMLTSTRSSTLWAAVASWDPELRYDTAPATAQDAQIMIEATRALMVLL